MADAHRRKFDTVVVWKFDRFARSVSHLICALENFRSLGIEFVSFSEQMDTSAPAGKMVFTVLGAVAELERTGQGTTPKRAQQGQAARTTAEDPGHQANCCASSRRRRLEAVRGSDGDWGRNYLPPCRRELQNSGKGFLNPPTLNWSLSA
jgi:DNA invertase Pin-like site-specific DNA recombinase